MRYIARILVRLLARVIALFYAKLSGLVGFWHASCMVGKRTTQLGVWEREFFYRRTLDEVGDGVHFAFGCNFSYQNVRIGDHVKIGYGNCIGLVDIGDNTLLGAYCFLPSGAHMHGIRRRDTPIRLQPGKLKRITIGKDCWIGAGSIVMADIGEGSVVGAGSVVTRAIPPWSIVAGNPAKSIGIRGDQDDQGANTVLEIEGE
jgi:virginiamycin A acetyltransferase